MELWTYEQESWAQGCETVCGVDEAGRGPLAGPVCAAAVMLCALDVCLHGRVCPGCLCVDVGVGGMLLDELAARPYVLAHEH